jgi:hypothetical protein
VAAAAGPTIPLDPGNASPALRAAALALDDAHERLKEARAAFDAADLLPEAWRRANPEPTGRRALKRWERREHLMPEDEQDIRTSLARAFDRAWGRYYRSGQLTVSQDVARTELARRLVQLSKEGIRDEGRLAAAGLSHLRQLPLKGGKTES